jgi:hypothetical protein
MHKEVLFAIFFGSLLGLIFAFGVWKANVAIKGNTSNEISNVEDSRKKDESKDNTGLTILKPKDKSVAPAKITEITGISFPDAVIVIMGEDGDTFAIADKNGEFKGTIDLVGGVNTIQVFALAGSGDQKKETLTLAYSSEFATDTKVTDSTESADLTETVKKRIKEATDSATIYMGTITDITESTIQLRDPDGDIKQVSLSSKETSYVNTIKTAKEVQFKDVAIGDFVAALGKINGNQVLLAKRVIITSAIKETGNRALIGKVTAIAKNEIDIQTLGKDDEWAIDTTPGVSVYSASDSAILTSKYTKIKKDMTVVVAAEKTEDETTGRSVLMLP